MRNHPISAKGGEQRKPTKPKGHQVRVPAEEEFLTGLEKVAKPRSGKP
jgi:hypothetical protein